MNWNRWGRLVAGCPRILSRGFLQKAPGVLALGFVTTAHAKKKDKEIDPQKFKMSSSQNPFVVRQNFSDEIEEAINRQINLELYASIVYLSMAAYFDRDDVALPGFAKFCKDNAEEERMHAWGLIKYQNDRGGRVLLSQTPMPPKSEWKSALEAMQDALYLEADTNAQLLTIHAIANNEDDSVIDAIKMLSDVVTRLKMGGTGVGVLMMDTELKTAVPHGGTHTHTR